MNRYPESLSSKRVGETDIFTFEIPLSSGETISSAVVAVAVEWGTDASPSAMLSGGASTSGANVSQKLTAGVAGNIYKVTCTATTSLSRIIQISAFLEVTA